MSNLPPPPPPPPPSEWSQPMMPPQGKRPKKSRLRRISRGVAIAFGLLVAFSIPYAASIGDVDKPDITGMLPTTTTQPPTTAETTPEAVTPAESDVSPEQEALLYWGLNVAPTMKALGSSLTSISDYASEDDLYMMKSACQDMFTITDDALDNLTEAPDAEIDRLWSGLLDELWAAAQLCESGIDDRNAVFISDATDLIMSANGKIRELTERLEELAS